MVQDSKEGTVVLEMSCLTLFIAATVILSGIRGDRGRHSEIGLCSQTAWAWLCRQL